MNAAQAMLETATHRASPEANLEDSRPPAILRGSARGLEVVVDGRATPGAITDALQERLEEAPAFFKGSDVRICVEDGPMVAGTLAALDEVSRLFGLRIVEVIAAKKSRKAEDGIPRTSLAAGSAPSPASPASPAAVNLEPGTAPMWLPPVYPAPPAASIAKPVTTAAAESGPSAAPTAIESGPSAAPVAMTATVESGPAAAPVAMTAAVESGASAAPTATVESGPAGAMTAAGESVPVVAMTAAGESVPSAAPMSVSAPVALESAPYAALLVDTPPELEREFTPSELEPTLGALPWPNSAIALGTFLSAMSPVRTTTVVAPATAVQAAAAAEPEPAFEDVDGTRVVVGPVRSGVILEHQGHLVVFGDVNPGAEVRAEGNIVVLGRLRGTAHAGIGRDTAFILALRLEPQQLRIGRMVARASESDVGGSDTEIAHVVGDAITVERYLGRLPRNLAASI